MARNALKRKVPMLKRKDNWKHRFQSTNKGNKGAIS